MMNRGHCVTAVPANCSGFINYDFSVNKTKNKKREEPDALIHHYDHKLFIRAKTMPPCFPGRGSFSGASHLVSGRLLVQPLTLLTPSPTEPHRLWSWSDREQGVQRWEEMRERRGTSCVLRHSERRLERGRRKERLSYGLCIAPLLTDGTIKWHWFCSRRAPFSTAYAG